jgi:hypothetical protein
MHGTQTQIAAKAFEIIWSKDIRKIIKKVAHKRQECCTFSRQPQQILMVDSPHFRQADMESFKHVALDSVGPIE